MATQTQLRMGITVHAMEERRTKTPVRGLGNHWLTYNVVVGPSPPQAPDRAKRFITNPAIRQAIGRMGLEMPYSIGRVVVSVDSGKAGTHLEIVSLYPFDEKAARKHLRGKGVASLIELTVEGDLMKRFPEAMVSATRNASLSRLWQLVARGRRPRKPIPIEQAYALTREYVLQERRRLRVERKLTPLRRRVARGKRLARRVGRFLRYA